MNSMLFGNRGRANVDTGGFELVESGYLGGENSDSVTISLESHQMYLLFTREITISSGAIRGFRAIQIARAESDSFSRQNLAASTNSGVTITNNTSDQSITLTPNAATYDVYYALYAIM